MKIKGALTIAISLLTAGLLAGCYGLPNGDVPETSPTSVPAESPTQEPASDLVCQDDFSAVIQSDTSVPGAYYIQLTNAGSAACSLRGFPAVELLDAADIPLGSMTESDAYQRAGAEVLVAPAQSAYIWIRFVEAANVNGECGDTAIATRIMLTLPGGKRGLEIKREVELCTASSELAQFEVGPVDSEARTASKGY